MYNVFFNDSLIIIASSISPTKDSISYPFKDFNLERIRQQIKTDGVKQFTFLSENINKDWQTFLRQVELIPAAGGLVTNDKQEVLFIYRNGIWDLPKGKIEKNESITSAAIREVEEECGIFNLKLMEKLITTYHIYEHKGFKLKETHWFLMHSSIPQQLIPQTEEGITKVEFKNEEEIQECFTNTYANIKLVYDTYKNKRSSKK